MAVRDRGDRSAAGSLAYRLDFAERRFRYSVRLQKIKEAFTRTYLATGGHELKQSRSRIEHGLRGVWLKRFWEHTIEDEDDLKECVDYVHWNPKKHGLVSSVSDWQWSSFHRFVAAEEYTLDWGREDPVPGYDDPEWGE